MKWQKTGRPGVYVRHQVGCAANDAGRCRCERSYRVRYRDANGVPRWSPTMKNEAEARNWRRDDQATKTGTARAEKAGKTFNDLTDEFMALAQTGAVTKKGGKAYGKGTLQAYRYMYNGHVRNELGKRDAARVTAVDWQIWIDALAKKGLKRNSINVTLNCVRAVYRWACAPTRQILTLNATTGLSLPAFDETARERVATPEEAVTLLAVLKDGDRVSYALAMYAGMRNVERKWFDWTDVDLNAGRLRIRFTKGDGGAGIRTLPIVTPLKAILREESLRQGRPTSGLVCRGPKGGVPDYESMKSRAVKAWEAGGLEPIGLHECRHTFITTMIASGMNAKAVSVLAGHASIDVTFDRYGHLFPGSEDEAGIKLDAFYDAQSAPVSNPVTNGAANPAESAL